MKRTWLIQRLKKPYGNKWQDMGFEGNPFEFGGGLLRGGLSKEAYAALNSAFSFDYMGSAEFEFGAVPAALKEIVDYIKKKDYANGMIEQDGKTVFLLCRESQKEEVSDLIKRLMKEEPSGAELKEGCYLRDALAGVKYHDYIGWIELDNAFMFFTDREAYDKVMLLFGLESSQMNAKKKEK